MFCIILYLYPFHVKNLKNLKKEQKTCLLITIYANTEDKIQMYSDIINMWLEKSSFEIYTVDSSGHFSESNHPRWHAFSFDQGDKGKKCYSVLEIEALEKAEHYFNFSQFDFVIKLTGKYFIPDLQQVSEAFEPHADFIFQKRHSFWVRFQNSELFAFKPGKTKLLKEHFQKSFERTLYNLSKKSNVFRMPPLKIETHYAREDGSTLTWL